MFRIALALAALAALAGDLSASNVTSRYRHHTVFLEGGDGDDDISVSRIDSDTIAVIGNGTTTIDDGNILHFHGDFRDLRIDLGQGSNHLDVHDFAVLRDLRVRTGNGDDLIDIETTDVGRDLRITAGSGANTITLATVQIFGDERVNCGKGPDLLIQSFAGGRESIHLRLGRAIGGKNEVDFDHGATATSRLRIDGGADPDELTLLSTVVLSSRIALFGGDDSVVLTAFQSLSNARLDCGAGNDTVNATNYSAGANRIDLGSGNNPLWFEGGGNDSIRIRSGDGNDSFVVTSVQTASELALLAGDGTNAVTISNCLVGADLIVHTGAGDDGISLSNNAVTGATTVKHGKGADIIN